MGRDFLKLKLEGKNLYTLVLAAGAGLALISGMASWRESRPENGNALPRNQAGGGFYEQRLTADIEGFGKLPLTVTVEERRLTTEEAEAELQKAAEILPELFKGENESLRSVTKNLNFVEAVPGTAVEVSWNNIAPEYFSADKKLREDLYLKEPATVRAAAVLSCQEYHRDFSVDITLIPQEQTAERAVKEALTASGEKSAGEAYFYLPKEYEGKKISWRKPFDVTFIYFVILGPAAVALLKLGEKRDAQLKEQERKEAFERGYAALVSRFAMLLSAGLSVRNAWERIVSMAKEHARQEDALFFELRRALGELQQGVPELEVYERVGDRIGLVRYKKLMSLFISDRRRGSISLRETMERELLEAWEEKKRLTRQQGEKIGTKLLLPMMGMLSIVFFIIIIPAFLSFRI